MKAAVVEEWGRAPIYTDHPEPVARDRGVVATVEASALTNLTKGLVSGKHYASRELTLPVIPGADGRLQPWWTSLGDEVPFGIAVLVGFELVADGPDKLVDL